MVGLGERRREGGRRRTGVSEGGRGREGQGVRVRNAAWKLLLLPNFSTVLHFFYKFKYNYMGMRHAFF